MSSFFRPEAVDGQRQAWLGQIQLIRPVSLTVLTTLAAAIAVATGVFLFAGQHTRKVQVSGVLVPDRGVLRVLAPQAGTVLESHVAEGRPVRRGELLFVLAVDQASEQGDTQSVVQQSLAQRQRSLAAAQQQNAALHEAQRQGLLRQREDLQRELHQMDQEARLQAQREALAQQGLDRLEALRAEQFVAVAQLQAKAEELLAVKVQRQALARARAGQLREIGLVETRLRELPLEAQVQQGALQRDLAGVAQASAETALRQRVLLRAPQDGVLTAVTAQVGQPVSPAAALATLLPEGTRLQAQLYAPSAAMGFVQADQAVRLRYPAYPYQKFGHQPGQVVQVSRTPLQPAELAALPLGQPGRPDEPLYRITVALEAQAVQAYGQARPLAPGMRVDADVLLDRRRLIEWIFEPLISVGGRL